MNQSWKTHILTTKWLLGKFLQFISIEKRQDLSLMRINNKLKKQMIKGAKFRKLLFLEHLFSLRHENRYIWFMKKTKKVYFAPQQDLFETYYQP